MIDADELLDDAQDVAGLLVDDLRERTESHEESRNRTRGTYERAHSAGRTDKSWEEWREDFLAQVAAGWVLGCVFVRFCEDNGLVETPLLSGPRSRRELARDHRSAFFAEDRTAGDREWLLEVFGRYRDLPGVADVFGERNPLWQLGPSADGARALMELWWATDDAGRALRHDFTDEQLDTRFLGDLYQDLSEHARKQFALLQTPEFVEEFILDHTLDPAIETFGLETVKMIDPAAGSGHFLLGSFDRLLERWRTDEPATEVRELAQRALDAINGVDVNPFAVAVARFRLLVAALKACDIKRLADSPNFELNVAVGDSLLHGSRPGRLLSGADEFSGALQHHYPTEDAEEADEILQAEQYHAVVGNPPYISVKDKALRDAYRALYSAAWGKYVLSVPFMVRLHDLAVPADDGPAGFVGQITSNSFMTRSFGQKIVKDYLPTRDLTHIIDTSGAYIPGHGTPTIIIFSRNRTPKGPVRAALGIRGEPDRPDDPAKSEVWSAILNQIDHPGSESDFISVEDIDQSRYESHPWSLQGGAAPDVLHAIESASTRELERAVDSIGVLSFTGEDAVYADWQEHQLERLRIEPEARRDFVEGDGVRDWRVNAAQCIFPYDSSYSPTLPPETARFLWPYRARLAKVLMFGKNKAERDKNWFEWNYTMPHRLRVPLSIVLAFVSTHNHFVLDRTGKVFKQSAPVIKLPDSASEDEHLSLIGLLNSSAGCFWMKQLFHNKGEGGGARVAAGYAAKGSEEWRNTYEFDSTKLKSFPLVDERPLAHARVLDEAAEQLVEVLPAEVAKDDRPTSQRLEAARVEATAIRARMVGLQEELDWECYYLYGLTDSRLTYPIEEVPALSKGERAFEIALARRMRDGAITSTWFERHGSTPITELPAKWPGDYRQLVERRLDLIESDRAIRLLERPQYKRRWYWSDDAALEENAQREWLLDRLEGFLSSGNAQEPEVTTVARLADWLWQDEELREVAEDFAGSDADPVQVVGRLVEESAVPYLAAYRLKEPGIRKRKKWEEVWNLQRKQDELSARARLPSDHPDYLSKSQVARAKQESGVERIPAPPKYKSAEYRDRTSWVLRGKLDVPRERFILYPDTRVGADTTTVIGWAGWDHLQQARVLAGLYTSRKHDGAEVDELTPMLAGILELLPWVKQWHDEPDPVYGERMGQFFSGFLDTERSAHGLTEDDLREWRP